MATRFYFPSSGTAPLSALDRDPGAWTLPTGSNDPEVSRLPLVTTKSNTALTTTTKTWPSTSSNAWCLFQFQSKPLAHNYSFVGDSVSVVIGKCIEATTSSDTFLEVVVRAVSNDGTVDRGVIIDLVGTEFPTTTAATRRIAGTDNAVDVFTGDRIVVEVGVYGDTPTTSDYSLRLGDPSAVGDFAWTNGLTTDLCSWLEINFDLEFADVILTGDGTQHRQTGTGTLTFGAAVDVVLAGDGLQRRQTGAGTITVSGVLLNGAGLQRRQLGAGALIFTDVDLRLIGHGIQNRQIGHGGLSLDGVMLIYGAGLQRRQHGNGILFSPIAGEEGAPASAAVQYRLLLDGVEYPLIRALIERHRSYERATATIPCALIHAILEAPPVTLAIEVIRRRLDGMGTEQVTLFTGAFNAPAVSMSNEYGRLQAIGSAIYSTRTNRLLAGTPSYVRDAADGTAARGQIDAAVVPGDVLRFSGVREIDVTKVVFNLDPDYSFMEAMNDY